MIRYFGCSIYKSRKHLHSTCLSYESGWILGVPDLSEMCLGIRLRHLQMPQNATMWPRPFAQFDLVVDTPPRKQKRLKGQKNKQTHIT